ncbi:hypothetical protein LTR86_000642 [Recurvomyces mirabilis]|nr:hypothetical protein LTR86_000642 [Recurvomyces mirabilis]
MQLSEAHIAGVGIAEHQSSSSLQSLAISASIKALLDAGVTYSDLDLLILGSYQERPIPRSALQALGQEGAPICEVDNDFALSTAIACIRSRSSNCSLVLGLDRTAGNGNVVVATIVVSNHFLTSHAYLKDQAINVLGSSLSSKASQDAAAILWRTIESALRQARLGPKDLQVVQAQNVTKDTAVGKALAANHVIPPLGQPTAELDGLMGTGASVEASAGETGLVALVDLVYRLRGWSHAPNQPVPLTQPQHVLHYTLTPSSTSSVLILGRSDGRPAPLWNAVKNIRDGRERLGYNPALENRGVTTEDLEAVRGRKGGMPTEAKQLSLPAKGGDRAALARL